MNFVIQQWKNLLIITRVLSVGNYKINCHSMYWHVYFLRYSKGGFYDELNHFQKSKFNFTIDHFEFLNEIEAEHATSPQDYTKRYDAVVKAVQSVVPNMKFVGLVSNIQIEN